MGDENVACAACSACSAIAEPVTLGADCWSICHAHGTRWWTGSNASSPAQTAAELADVVRLLRRYRPLRPIDASIPPRPSAMEQKLDAICRARSACPVRRTIWVLPDAARNAGVVGESNSATRIRPGPVDVFHS